MKVSIVVVIGSLMLAVGGWLAALGSWHDLAQLGDNFQGQEAEVVLTSWASPVTGYAIPEIGSSMSHGSF